MTRARRWSLALVAVAVVLGLTSVAARARTTDLERLHDFADELALDPPAGFTYEMTLRGKLVESGAYRFPFDGEKRAPFAPEHVVNVGEMEFQRISEVGYVETKSLRGLDALIALNHAGSALSDATSAVRRGSQWTFCGSDSLSESNVVGRATERNGLLTSIDVRGEGTIGAARDRVVIRDVGAAPAIEIPSPVVEPPPPSGPAEVRAIPNSEREFLEPPVTQPPPEPKCTVPNQAGMLALEHAHELAAIILVVAWALWRRDGRSPTSGDVAAAVGVALLVVAVSVAVLVAARSAENREFRAYESDVERHMRNARIDTTGSREPTVVLGQRSAHDFGDFYGDSRVALTPPDDSRRGERTLETPFAKLSSASRFTNGTRHLCGGRNRGVARYRGDVLREVVVVDESSASQLRILAPAELAGDRDPTAVRARLMVDPPLPPLLPFVRKETFCPPARLVKIRDAAGGVPGTLVVTVLFGEAGGALLRDSRKKRPNADA